MPPANQDVILEKIANLQADVSEIKSAMPQLVLDVDRVKGKVSQFEAAYSEWRKTLIGVGVTFALGTGSILWGILTHSIIISAKVP